MDTCRWSRGALNRCTDVGVEVERRVAPLGGEQSDNSRNTQQEKTPSKEGWTWRR